MSVFDPTIFDFSIFDAGLTPVNTTPDPSAAAVILDLKVYQYGAWGKVPTTLTPPSKPQIVRDLKKEEQDRAAAQAKEAQELKAFIDSWKE
jgi:hypothetical protein